MPKALRQNGEAGRLMMRDGRQQILARDSMTRFSYAWGPLCRWPELSVEQVKEQVLKDLRRMARRVW